MIGGICTFAMVFPLAVIARGTNTRALGVLALVCVLASLVLFSVGTITSWRLNFARCPRCDARFCGTWWLSWPFSRKCWHCDLSIHARFDPSHENLLTLRQWLAHPEPRGPTPNIGLHCADCGYSLAELPEQRCPECGTAFDIEAILAQAVSQIRT